MMLPSDQCLDNFYIKYPGEACHNVDGSLQVRYNTIMKNEANVFFLGQITSPLKELHQCPRQGHEGGTTAIVHINPEYTAALRGVEVGSKIILITWLDKADRSILQVFPRGDRNKPLTGVFLTRSPSRPNPVGLHDVTVMEIPDGNTLVVEPLEVLDGTPIIDIKLYRTPNGDSHAG